MPPFLKRLSVPAALAAAAAAGFSCSRGAPEGSWRGANVILLVIDTLRADHLGCYGYFRDTSPGIDALARESVVFENAFCSIPITLPSHASIFTGLYPQQTGVLRNWGRLDDEYTTLAEILKQHGYATAAVVGTAVLKKEKNLNQGFDEYFQNWGISPRVPAGEGKAWEMKGLAEDADRMAWDWLGRVGKRPFFLMINYYDVHGPYIEHERYRDTFDPDSEPFREYLRSHYDRDPDPAWKRTTITYYDRSLRYLDDELSGFLKKLDRNHLLDDTLVIVTSDHGNGLYQHRDYWSHGRLLFDEQIHVPLIVRFPKGSRTGRVRGLVESVDILPGILELLGIEPPAGLDGKSFLPLIAGKDDGDRSAVFAMSVLEDTDGEPLPRRFAVRTDDAKLVYSLDGDRSYYDLRRDPLELNALAADPETGNAGRRAKNLIARGLNWYKREKVESRGQAAIDEQTRRELEALGYIAK